MTRYLRLIRNVSNWWLHLLVKAGLYGKDPLVFRLPNGIRVETPRRLMHEFKEIFMEECYSRRLAPLPDRPVVVDIGANVGFFSLFVASRYPRATVAAVEPIPGNCRQLARNIGLNPQAALQYRQAAVYGHTGSIELSFEAAEDFTTAASVFSHPASRSETLEVACFSLADLLDEFGFDRCDLMKMDCEGAEYAALYGASAEVLARFDQMVIEVHRAEGPEENIASLARFLAGNGFATRTAGDILYAARSRHRKG